MTVSISVISDVVCPWCFIGKRRLERALDGLGLAETATIRWFPFELNPDMPEAGMPRAEYRAAKFGQERADQLDREMTARGLDEGIAFAFERIAKTPSTRRAHRLIAHAAREARDGALAETLFRAYFEEARDIGTEEVLLEVGASIGLDRTASLLALADEALDHTVTALEHRAHEIGVSGVPFFIVNEEWALSGAQTAEQWTAALRARLTPPPAAAG